MKIAMITLGCPKNVVDSEVLRAWLTNERLEFVAEANQADVIIINTCAFILPAREEAIDTILEAVTLKKAGKAQQVFVVGCLPQISAEELTREIPEVDAFFPHKDFDFIGKQIVRMLNLNAAVKLQHRVLETPNHYAYLKISDGCDNRCHYCTIPQIKGRHRSRRLSDLIDEARELADNGVKEIILVAQDTTYYGRDIGDRGALIKLIKSLAKIDQFKWIRLLYAHPAHVEDELIDLFKEEEKLCRYIDLPVQHISDKILKSMGRQTTKSEINRLIEKLRKNIPGIAIRTTLIVGYPGESEKDFQELKQFISDVEFERLGAFKYIAEEGTKAAAYRDQIDESVKEDRFQEIMEVQYEISKRKNNRMIGETISVIVDEKEMLDGFYQARTQWDSPLIDNIVHIRGEINIGDMYHVKIKETDAYDMWGEIHSAASCN